jgi:7-carboxy-7-deazaguanine synthase
MCDSLHAVDPRYVKANAKWMESSEILSAVADLPFVPWITLSGGNPAIHDLGFLVRGLQTMEFKVAVETQGTLSPSWINMLDAITISPKPPGMGEKFERDKFVDACHKFAHHPGFNIKIPVFSAQDLEFAAMIADIVTLFIHPLQQEGRMFLSLGNPYPPTLDGKTGSGIALGITGQEPKNTAELTQTLMECFELTAQDIFQHPGLKVYRFLPQLHVLVWGNARGK